MGAACDVDQPLRTTTVEIPPRAYDDYLSDCLGKDPLLSLQLILEQICTLFIFDEEIGMEIGLDGSCVAIQSSVALSLPFIEALRACPKLAGCLAFLLADGMHTVQAKCQPPG